MNERNNESRNGGRNENDAVDLVATAQAVQQAGDAWRRPGTVKLVAPAKVNLFLGIGSRREDGYHEAVSILHAIALHDVLYLRRATAPADSGDEAVALAGPAHNISVRVECIAREGLAPLSVAASENIVFRATRGPMREAARSLTSWKCGWKSTSRIRPVWAAGRPTPQRRFWARRGCGGWRLTTLCWSAWRIGWAATWPSSCTGVAHTSMRRESGSTMRSSL